jgi:hypothetical protein
MAIVGEWIATTASSGPSRRRRERSGSVCSPIWRVLSDDYFSVPMKLIADITSVLTLLGGKPVHADAELKDLAPPLPPPMPGWSPVGAFGGYQKRPILASSETRLDAGVARHAHISLRPWARLDTGAPSDDRAFWGALCRSCWAL